MDEKVIEVAVTLKGWEIKIDEKRSVTLYPRGDDSFYFICESGTIKTEFRLSRVAVNAMVELIAACDEYNALQDVP